MDVKVCIDCEEEKPITDYPYVWKKRNEHRKNRCKKCYLEYNKQFRRSWDYTYRWKKYGMGLVDYNLMLEQQDNKCAICQREASTEQYKTFNIDHNHKTGEIRGLLCNNCNTGLGLFKDDVVLLNKAIEYLSLS